MRYRLLPLAILIPVLANAADERPPVREPNRSPEDTAKVMRGLEHRIREIMDQQKVPGVGIVVVKDDKVVFLKGFGYRNLEKKLPFTPDTITHIASTSKAFCGVTACMAAEDGLLSLDESPKRLLPDFKMVDPEADKGMTIADLLFPAQWDPKLGIHVT